MLKSTPQVLYLSADKHLWVADNGTSKIVKYDSEGQYLYSWGSQGEWPGAMWNVHGMSVDQEGNLYPSRPGANPAFVIGQPVRAAWK